MRQLYINRVCCNSEIIQTTDDDDKVLLIHSDAYVAANKLLNRYYEAIRLIYIDPPFNTGKQFYYKQPISKKGYNGDKSMHIKHIAYDDSFKDGNTQYIAMMKQVITVAYKLLDEQGSIYVHVDYRVSAYIRLMLDEVFGENNFLNEIIWHYRSGGRATKHFSRKHDVIFFYKKGKKNVFNPLAAAKRRGDQRKNHMKKQVDSDGRVYYSIRTNGKLYKYYDDDPVYPSDVWDDISHLQQKDPERTNYDTQKPLALLKRIIGVSTNPGDLVLDLFCGSGTTLAAAQELGRSAIGVDASQHAINVCRKRLLSKGSSIAICYENNDVKEAAYIKIDYSIENDDLTMRIVKFATKDWNSGYYDNKNTMQISLNDRHAFQNSIEYNDLGDNDNCCGVDAIDYIALGEMANNEFTVIDYRSRIETYGDINTAFSFNLKDKKKMALHIVDVLGRNHYFSITP